VQLDSLQGRNGFNGAVVPRVQVFPGPLESCERGSGQGVTSMDTDRKRKLVALDFGLIVSFFRHNRDLCNWRPECC
jgi:hypothetical protein